MVKDSGKFTWVVSLSTCPTFALLKKTQVKAIPGRGMRLGRETRSPRFAEGQLYLFP
jgi:hypothetical protein